jgi:hypothetical protein
MVLAGVVRVFLLLHHGGGAPEVLVVESAYGSVCVCVCVCGCVSMCVFLCVFVCF